MKCFFHIFFFLLTNWAVPLLAQPLFIKGYEDAQLVQSVKTDNIISYKELERLANRLYEHIKKQDDVGGDEWHQEALQRGFGDCEDFVLTLRKLLIERHISNHSFAVAITKPAVMIDKKYHTILLVDTKERGVVAFDIERISAVSKHDIVAIINENNQKVEAY